MPILNVARHYYLSNYNGWFDQTFSKVSRDSLPKSTASTDVIKKLVAKGDILYDYDYRLPAVSILNKDKPVDDLQLIYNYTKTFCAAFILDMDKVLYFSDFNMKLSLGLIPIAIFPADERLSDKVNYLEYRAITKGFKVHKLQGTFNHTLRSQYRTIYDLWTDRFSAAEVLGTTPENVKTLNILKEVIS